MAHYFKRVQLAEKNVMLQIHRHLIWIFPTRWVKQFVWNSSQDKFILSPFVRWRFNDVKTKMIKMSWDEIELEIICAIYLISNSISISTYLMDSIFYRFIICKQTFIVRKHDGVCVLNCTWICLGSNEKNRWKKLRKWTEAYFLCNNFHLTRIKDTMFITCSKNSIQPSYRVKASLKLLNFALFEV